MLTNQLLEPNFLKNYYIYKKKNMKTVSFKIPDSLDMNEPELRIILAGELYERGKLSLGQAAELAGFSKRAFIEIMGKYGFSLFSQSEEDLLSDIENA